MNAAEDTFRYETSGHPGEPRRSARGHRPDGEVAGARPCGRPVAFAAAGVLALAIAGPSFAATATGSAATAQSGLAALRGGAAVSRTVGAKRTVAAKKERTVAAKKAPACLPPLWTNPPHTAKTADTGFAAPQLSLLAGNMATIDAGTVLQVSLTVSDLTDSVPLGATAEDWYATWTYKGTSYFANAQLSAVPGSTPTFGDGTLVRVGTENEYSQAHTDTGKFITGKDGRVIVDVPLANVGKPPMGASLGYPAGDTYTEEGVPPNPKVGGALLEAVDTGGPNNPYSVGMATGTCR